MQVETSRLRLRPFYDSDLEALVKLANNWAVAKWLATLPYPYQEEHARAWIGIVRKDHEAGNPRKFAFALKENDQLIGGGGLDGSTGDGSVHPALGYWIGEPYQGRGYAKEVVAALVKYGFEKLGLEAISAHTDPTNAKSQKILTHCGLKPDGEITLIEPTKSSGATRAPHFRIMRAEFHSP